MDNDKGVMGNDLRGNTGHTTVNDTVNTTCTAGSGGAAGVSLTICWAARDARVVPPRFFSLAAVVLPLLLLDFVGEGAGDGVAGGDALILPNDSHQ